MVNFETWSVGMKNKYVVLDFETTGINKYYDEVVQVAIMNQNDEIFNTSYVVIKQIQDHDC